MYLYVHALVVKTRLGTAAICLSSAKILDEQKRGSPEQQANNVMRAIGADLAPRIEYL